MIFEKNLYECCWGRGYCPLYLSLVLMARLIIKLTQDQINRRKTNVICRMWEIVNDAQGND